MFSEGLRKISIISSLSFQGLKPSDPEIDAYGRNFDSNSPPSLAEEDVRSPELLIDLTLPYNSGQLNDLVINYNCTVNACGIKFPKNEAKALFLTSVCLKKLM